MASPSSTAYSGAVTGDHSFLNTVTSATTRPPIRPPQTKGIRPSMPPVKNRLQVYIAAASVSTSRNAVLLTVPFRVMAPASRRTTAPVPRSRKVDSESAGLPLRMEILVAAAKGSGRKHTQGQGALRARVDRPAPAPDNSRPFVALARLGSVPSGGV